jgi:hypothetical protein
MLVIGGLFAAGENKLAAEAAGRVLGAMETIGARDSIAAQGEQPIRRPADDFNPMGGAAMIYIANLLSGSGKE